MILLPFMVLPLQFESDREVSGVSNNVSYLLSRQAESFDRPDAVPGTLFVGPIFCRHSIHHDPAGYASMCRMSALGRDETRCQEACKARFLSLSRTLLSIIVLHLSCSFLRIYLLLDQTDRKHRRHKSNTLSPYSL